MPLAPQRSHLFDEFTDHVRRKPGDPVLRHDQLTRSSPHHAQFNELPAHRATANRARGRWTTLAPSAVEAPCTSTALPLLRLISRTWPASESARRSCWSVPSPRVHWLTREPSAVDASWTSSPFPLLRLTKTYQDVPGVAVQRRRFGGRRMHRAEQADREDRRRHCGKPGSPAMSSWRGRGSRAVGLHRFPLSLVAGPIRCGSSVGCCRSSRSRAGSGCRWRCRLRRRRGRGRTGRRRWIRRS